MTMSVHSSSNYDLRSASIDTAPATPPAPADIMSTERLPAARSASPVIGATPTPPRSAAPQPRADAPEDGQQRARRLLAAERVLHADPAWFDTISTIANGVASAFEEGANYLEKHAPRFAYPGSVKVRNKAFVDAAALMADKLQDPARLMNRYHQAMLAAHPDIKEDALEYALRQGANTVVKTSGAMLRAKEKVQRLGRTRAQLHTFHANLILTNGVWAPSIELN